MAKKPRRVGPRPSWTPTPAQLVRLRERYAELTPEAREVVRRAALVEGRWLLEVLEKGSK